MKLNIYFFIITALFITFMGCDKAELNPLEEIPPITIKTEACFSPHGITLILAHPDDNFYYEDQRKYKVDWYDDSDFLHSGTRLSCVENGEYRVEVQMYAFDFVKRLTCTVKLENDL